MGRTCVLFTGLVVLGCAGTEEQPRVPGPPGGEPPTLEERMDDLLEPIADEVGRVAGAKRVSVQGFYDAYTDRDLRLSEFLTPRLVRALVAGGVSLVERHALDRILAEQNRQGSDLFDPDTQRTIGRLAGADLVLLCPVTRPDDVRYRVEWKLVDLTLGDVLAAGEFDVDRTELPVHLGGV
ncbi:MAG: CsgG/HfaB family protein [Planctomycetota bacterium]